MSDNLAIIERVIEEHQAIRGHVKLVGDSLNDRESLDSFMKSHASLIPGRVELLSEEKDKLNQTISSLEEGLYRHFYFEEKILPPLFGELLMKALVLEHRAIRNEIERTKETVANIKLDGLRREEILSQEAQIQDVIDYTCQLIEEHAVKEEGVLSMLREALQDEGEKES